jgi:glucose-6-phosphate 1-dehydrogenase
MTAVHVPTVFVIFGATGDLMEKKIVPALFRLHTHGKLPKLFQVLAVSRREMTAESFGEQILTILKKTPESVTKEPEMEAFMSLFHYVSGDFGSDELYDNLAERLGSVDDQWKTCSNKIYYLAVPPVHYESIVTHLGKKNLNTPCSDTDGYTRIVLEKPFGSDDKTSQELTKLLSTHFTEDQIYRLDHYLGKAMLQNIMAFRFSNTFFDGAWSNKYIEKVEIKLLETNDVDHRGAFYDALGAFRDVGQNHLLEFVAMIAMEKPETFTAESVRSARAQVLSSLLVIDDGSLVNSTYRAQYDGYLQHDGVAEGSTTETYFKVEFHLDHPKWRGVPFILESGKGLATQKKEVVINFKKAVSPMFPKGEEIDSRNKMLFKLEPEESIQLDLWAKREGYEMVVDDKRFYLNERDAKTRVQYTEEYEKLLLYVFLGDQTFFVSTEEINQMWRVTDPIVAGFKNHEVPLNHYPLHTDTVRALSKEWIDKPATARQVTEIGIVGLGKMGANLSKNLLKQGYKVVGMNRSPEATNELVSCGLTPSYTLEELVQKLAHPRVIWLMLPQGEPTHETVEKLSTLLEADDIVIDAGNSPFAHAADHSHLLREKGIEFVDVGVSGGPDGALNGVCILVGGNKVLFEHLLHLYTDLSVPGGVANFEGVGAGHFAKMVHNGIEYGMMQAIAEGMTILKESPFAIDLPTATVAFSHGSVIESKLLEWLTAAFAKHGADLAPVKGSVDSLGEGAWTVEYAESKGIIDWAIKAAVDYRTETLKNPSFTGKILSAIRGEFGGHPVHEQKS